MCYNKVSNAAQPYVVNFYSRTLGEQSRMLSEAHDDNMDLKYRVFTGGTAEGVGFSGMALNFCQSGVYFGRLIAFSVKA